MKDLKGKKLLILSGNGLNCKTVEAAKELGVYTIVVDYVALDSSPAKQIADEHWTLSYSDIDGIEQRCKQEHVDGVIACSGEATQLPYYRICERMHFPCYATLNQFEKLTNKKKFKAMCRENGIDVIPEFTKEDVESKTIEFPVFVKPVDNGGSKGQSVCNNYSELVRAIAYAESESATKEIIIEKYMGGKTSFQVTYFFVNGVPYVIRTVDGYKGLLEEKLDRVALCSISPSRYTYEFFQTTNDRFTRMLKCIGVENGPVMAQGFFDDGTFRFYDPGRRFPGTDYELIYKDVFGIDLMQMMVIFSLTGKMPEIHLDNQYSFLNGKKAAVLFPTVRAGVIGKIEGIDKLRADPWIRHIVQKYFVGDTVNWTYTTMQRICDIDFVCETDSALLDLIDYIQNTLKVQDENGIDMIYKPFDATRLIL